MNQRRISAWMAVLAGLWLAACQPVNPIPSLPVGGQGLPVKIVTGQAGFYQVTSQQVNLAGLDLSSMRLTRQGQEIPLFPQEDGFRFYAPGGSSRYADQDIYWLTDGPAPQTASPALELPTAWSGVPGLSPRQVRLEENLLYWPLAQQGDPWFWKLLAAPAAETFEVVIPVEPAGTAVLQVAVSGRTTAPADPDHAARLSLNGQVILEEEWEGSGAHLLRVELSAGLLRRGSNSLGLELPGLQEVSAEVTYLDWITVDYSTGLEVTDDRLEWISDGQSIQLSGFSEPVEVYDLGDRLQPLLVQRSTQASFEFSGQSGRRYLALGARGARSPLALQAPEILPDLREPGLAADLLVVGDADLLEAARPLIEWREQHGVRTLAVTAQAAYDQFGGGLRSPQAIRELVRASREWSTPPRSLLLLGDASFDPLGYTSPAEANRLPVWYIFTEYGGETGSDLPYVDLDGDILPDLAVGRLPARSAEQVGMYVRKVIAFEQAGSSARLAVSVADGQEANFALDAHGFMALLPEDIQRLELTPPAGSTEAAAQVAQAFGQAPWLVAYFGHGSIQMWGKDSLFNVEDVASLPQVERAPIVIHMTCLSGLFIHPRQESLSEALLWHPGGGAVTVLAPTSLTLAADQSQLSQPLAVALSDGNSQTIGDAMLRAWRQMPVDSSGARDVLLTFLLLGDPELRLEGIR